MSYLDENDLLNLGDTCHQMRSRVFDDESFWRPRSLAAENELVSLGGMCFKSKLFKEISNK